MQSATGILKVSTARERSQLIRPPVGLIRLRHQMPTTERVLGSQIEMGGLGIDKSPRTGVTTQVSTTYCGYSARHLFFIPIGLQGQRTHKDSVEERSEQLSRNTPNLHPAGSGSMILNQREHEGRGPGVQQDSEATSNPVDDLIRPGTEKGKSRCSCYTTIHTDLYQLRREVGLTRILGALHL